MWRNWNSHILFDETVKWCGFGKQFGNSPKSSTQSYHITQQFYSKRLKNKPTQTGDTLFHCPGAQARHPLNLLQLVLESSFWKRRNTGLRANLMKETDSINLRISKVKYHGNIHILLRDYFSTYNLSVEKHWSIEL